MPIDYQALILLQEINFNRIKDCTQAMQDAISYSCSKGVMNGWGPERMAQEIRRCIDGNQNMGIQRARTIARTEIISAYNAASETRYKAAGLTRDKMIWITALDDRTCEICAPRDGKTIAEIGEIPAAHPNCRCCIAPNPDNN
jgi:SPP1 gp7 family putative phage head morphogenesis protein